MERGLIVLVATLVLLGAAGVQGTQHLSFAQNMTVNITRDGCGSSKLCVENATNCDPTMDNMCFFVSAEVNQTMPPSGTEFAFEVAGYSPSAIAMGLTSGNSLDTTQFFICYIGMNSTFRFGTMERNCDTGEFSSSETVTREIRGSVTGRMIRCEFNVPMLNSSMPGVESRANSDTNFTVELLNGTFSNGTFTPVQTRICTGFVNISDPTLDINMLHCAAENLHATALLVLLSLPFLFALLAP